MRNLSTVNSPPAQQSDAVPEDFILVVDDEPANLSLLKETLSSTGLKIRVVTSGLKALDITRKEIPSLILLDIAMPEMDGFETCRRIKAQPITAAVPIIFATAATEIDQKMKGFELGAVDYITKPFQVEEVLARVKVQLQLQQLTLTLRTKNQQLEQEVQARTAAEEKLQNTNQQLEQSLQELRNTQVQLIQSEKMSSLGHLVAGVAHEINNPINFIRGNLLPTQEYAEALMKLVRLYQQHYPDEKPAITRALREIDVAFIQVDFPNILASMKTGTQRISEIVNSLKKFAYLDEALMKQIDLHEGIENTLVLLSHRLKLGSDRTVIEVVKDYGKLPCFECYPDQLNQVLMHLLSNAIDVLEKDVESGRNSLGWVPQIRLRTRREGDEVLIMIGDNGEGIKKDLQGKIFEPLFTTKPTGKGTGLGLAISHQIVVEKHGGLLEVSSEPGQGTTFTIRLPIQKG